MTRIHWLATRCQGQQDRINTWFIWLLLEIAVPAGTEFRERPRVHLFQLLLGRPNLDTCFDAVGGKWTRAVNIPLVEHFFLGLFVAAGKVIE